MVTRNAVSGQRRRIGRHKLVGMYLDWVNNFITVRAFAAEYQISICRAHRVIMIGRRLHERMVNRAK